MQTNLNSNAISHTPQSLDNPGFNQLEQSLSGAIADFSEQSPAIFAAIFGAVRPVGDYAMKGAKFMAGYTRRHPVRIGVTVVGLAGLGILAARWMKPSIKASVPLSSDGRQY